MNSPHLSVSLKNDLAEIERLSQLVEALGEREQLSPDLLYAMNLALDEILTNVISYGYEDDAEHQIEVRVVITSDEVVAEVEDDARPFDPTAAPAANTAAALAEREIGGLGIHFVRQLMDHVEYHRADQKNRLIMSKKFPSK